MQTKTRWHTAARVAAAAAAGALGWLLVAWLIRPAPICTVLGDAGPSFTCPNRFGFSLPSPVIVALHVLGAAAVAFFAWDATRGPAEDR